MQRGNVVQVRPAEGVFHSFLRLDGEVEVELATQKETTRLRFESVDEMTRQWHLPSWVTREVSDDVRFTGGLLAELANGQVAELIRS